MPTTSETISTTISTSDVAATCACGHEHAATDRFYVSVIDGRRTGLLAGPFTRHETALGLVDVVRALAERANPWAYFYSFGTASIPAANAEPGRLNHLLSADQMRET